MKKIINLIFIIISLTSISTTAQNNTADKPIVIANDYEYKDANVHFTGTENLIFLPENRLKKDSRKIAINFFRIKAKNDTGLPPVVYLPGGPGSVFLNYMFGEKYGGKHGAAFGKQMTIVNETRDILVINQRGNPKIPGTPEPDFVYKFNAGDSKEITNPKKWGKNLRKSFVANANFFNETGMDLRGYDFIQMVDDIESIRAYYNYDKISFVAGSFGTQWAIGYMSRYPDNLDRALFYDVEPLSHSDDDPEFVWNAFERIEERAINASNLKGKLPKIGLLNAVKVIVKRLEEKPVWVKIESDSILIGANDFKRNLGYPFGPVEAWPKYITELYNGDYRLLALWAKENRGGIAEVNMINSLVNLSIGISQDRHELLTNREELKWMSSWTSSHK